MVERNMCNAVMRGTVIPPGSKSTSRANGLRRNLGYPTSGRRLRVRSRVRRSASGRRGAVADDARAWEVGRGHSSCEAGEQGRAICCGIGGAKGRGQGECAPSKHAPDTVPGSACHTRWPHAYHRVLSTCHQIDHPYSGRVVSQFEFLGDEAILSAKVLIIHPDSDPPFPIFWKGLLLFVTIATWMHQN